MNLIVMLTHNDRTVENAKEVFESCKDLPVQHWGFKDVGLPIDQMKDLVKTMKEAGKTTYLEVVSYTEEECMAGAKLAVECGFDYLMGTLYYQSVVDFLKQNNIHYYPFCGEVWGSPSILGNSIEGIIDSAKEFEKKGIEGTDLLAYRFTGDAEQLIKDFTKEIKIPTVIAGSINTFERIDFMKRVNCSFTIGSAFFKKDFVPTGSFRENLIAAYYYMKA